MSETPVVTSETAAPADDAADKDLRANRRPPTSPAFREFVAADWAPRDETLPDLSPSAPYAAARRATISEAFPGERLVVPAGGLVVRSNDTDYQFRPHTAFAWLTGLGTDQEPDAVLVMEPLADGGHESTLYFRPLAPRDSEEFFADSRYGEFWVGARPTLETMEATLGMRARHIADLQDSLAKDAGTTTIRVVREADAAVAAMVSSVRQAAGVVEEQSLEADAAFAKHLSVARMVKDEWEIEQLQLAVDGTHRAFEAVIAQLPLATAEGRGERWVEGVFGLHARHQGNGVGYDSICAAGDHANTLHWIKNTGEIVPGDLLLLDAGVEVDALYTADITRTMPVNGTFTPVQRKVYDAVVAAQAAGIAACKPGNKFSDIHAAAIRVIAEHLHEWGLLPDGVSVDDTLDADNGGWHRRWMVHGTSHHLGLDVHDCALALREEYSDAELAPGMCLTVEPGLYFKKDDLKIPEELRGMGVRIEDDIVITEDGCRNLSGNIPHTADEVEAWMAEVWARQS